MNNQSKTGDQPASGQGEGDATIPEVTMADAPERTPAPPKPVKHQKATSNEAVKRITAYLLEKGAGADVVEAWQCILGERERLKSGRDKDSHVTGAIQEMRKEMQALKEGVKNMENKLTGKGLDANQSLASGGNSPTYASVAAAAAEIRRPGRAPITVGIKPVPARLERELLIHTGDKAFDKTGAQIVQLVNNQMETGKALAGRRLPSGDYIITLDSKDTKEAWQKQTAWLEVFGEKAQISRREFSILAHGIVINQLQTQDQLAAIRRIYGQNPGLQGKAEILRATWTKGTIRKWEQKGRPANGTGPLLISLASPEQANYIIDNGLIWGYQIHECEPYCGDCQVTQCFKCYKYGHTQKMCPVANRCGFCSLSGHKEEDCQVREDQTKWKCVNCPQGKNNHTSWSKKCPVKQEKQEAARKAYQERPYRFQELTSPRTVRDQSPTGSFTFVASTQRSTEPDQGSNGPQSSEDWEEVTRRRRGAASPIRGASNPKKARRGPPTLGERLQKAASQFGQEKLSFNSN
jgi:hypothetical protein